MHEITLRPNAAPGVHESILSLLKTEPRGKILDMSAYEGALSQSLKQMGFDVVACDVQPEKLKFKEIPCIYYDFNSNENPFHDNSFDMIICTEVIEHLGNPRNLIKVIRRILKKDGKVIISLPNIPNIGYSLM